MLCVSQMWRFLYQKVEGQGGRDKVLIVSFHEAPRYKYCTNSIAYSSVQGGVAVGQCLGTTPSLLLVKTLLCWNGWGPRLFWPPGRDPKPAAANSHGTVGLAQVASDETNLK